MWGLRRKFQIEKGTRKKEKEGGCLNIELRHGVDKCGMQRVITWRGLYCCIRGHYNLGPLSPFIIHACSFV